MRFFLFFFLVVFMAVSPSCKSEDGDYSGVGKLIADRHKVRYQIAEKKEDNKDKPGPSNQKNDLVSKDTSQRVTPKKELTTNVLNKKKIVIVETSSGKSLGQGVAYVNQKGKIVKIKLTN